MTCKNDVGRSHLSCGLHVRWLQVHKQDFYFKNIWLCKKSPLGKRIDSIIDHQNQIKDPIVTFFYKPKSIKHIRSIWQQKIDDKVEKQDKKELDIVVNCREKAKAFLITLTYKCAMIEL